MRMLRRNPLVRFWKGTRLTRTRKNCRFQGIVQRGVEIAEAVDAELLENAQLQKNICEPAGAGDGVDHPEIQAKD